MSSTFTFEDFFCCILPILLLLGILILNLITKQKNKVKLNNFRKPITTVPKIIPEPEPEPEPEIIIPLSSANVLNSSQQNQMSKKIESAPRNLTVSTDDIVLTEQFETVFDLIENQDKNVFITGKAGTGKSTLLRYFVENTKKRVVILAPTGLAAINVGGSTIHSFFRFPIEPLKKEDIHESFNKELYQSVDIIIIDEISMVRADMFDNIDQFLGINRGYPSLPFGGTQIILFGDPYQLAPIVSTQAESQYLSQRYDSSWFFDAESFRSGAFMPIELSKVFRQKDKNFIALLDNFRKGSYQATDLTEINSRVRKPLKKEDLPIFLTTTNKLSNNKNDKELSKLPSKEKVFVGQIEGEFTQKTLPTLMELKLKEGAQVMTVRNDTEKRWVNGTIGKIIEINDGEIKIEIIKNDVAFHYSVEPVVWEQRRYTFDFAERKIISEVIGTFTQYPLRLAWAITIHKSQGLTFDHVGINLGSGAFSNGQTYVALSRCTSIDGISLTNPITTNDIKVDFHMRNWMNRTFCN